MVFDPSIYNIIENETEIGFKRGKNFRIFITSKNELLIRRENLHYLTQEIQRYDLKIKDIKNLNN